MAGKKGAKKAETVSTSGSKLKQATWHKGRMYDPASKKDRADFDAMLAKDDKLAKVARTSKAKTAAPEASDSSAAADGGAEGGDGSEPE